MHAADDLPIWGRHEDAIHILLNSDSVTDCGHILGRELVDGMVGGAPPVGVRPSGDCHDRLADVTE